MEHVVWIGGGTGSGKTTAARALARRHGLRGFHVDAFWYAHDARLGEPRIDADERWLVPTPAEQAAAFEDRARRAFRLVLEDLAALPAAPPVVVEGPQLVPDLLPPGASAVFLVPSPGFQRAVLEGRPMPSSDPARALANRLEKDRLYAERVAALAEACGFPTVRVDGSRSPDEILAEVELLLAPLPEDDGDLAEARRWENEAVATNLRSWHASPEALAKVEPSYAFSCECGRAGCAERVELTISEYGERARVVAPGH